MNKLLLFITLICSVFISSDVFANDKTYRCEVLSDAYIRESGVLDVQKDSPRVGQKFVVTKSTGEVIGDIMDPLKNPKVVSLGSEKNSYKVIWEQKSAGKKSTFVDYLNIDEFAKGKSKPFGFFSGSLLMTGLCELI